MCLKDSRIARKYDKLLAYFDEVFEPDMSLVPILALASAGLYCVAMIAMKTWWSIPGIWTAGIIVLALLAAGALEVAALRNERLGLIYVSILAAEVVIIGVASHVLFKETYSAREIAGVTLVLLGTALAWA